MTELEIQTALKRYKFYHIIELSPGITTPGYELFVPAQKLCMKYLKSLDVRGKRVLDIGCRDGLFSFAAEQMGAAEVVGIDNDLSKPATEFLIPYFKSKVKMVQMNLYDLTPAKFGLFDVVIFPGVLYHLRYPFWGLRAIRSVLGPDAHLITETPIWRAESNNAMLFCPIGKDSPYETSSCTFFNEKGLADTLTSLGFETMAVEYVEKPARSLADNVKQMADTRSLLGLMKKVKTYVERGIRAPESLKSRPPIQKVTRTVFHSKFVGTDANSDLNQYWEGTHDIHTRGL